MVNARKWYEHFYRVWAFLVVKVKLSSAFAYTISISCIRIQSTRVFMPCLTNTLYCPTLILTSMIVARRILCPLFVFGFPWLLARLVTIFHDYWPFVLPHLWITGSYPVPIFLLDCAFFLFDLWEPFMHSVYQTSVISMTHMPFLSITHLLTSCFLSSCPRCSFWCQIDQFIPIHLFFMFV